MTHFSGGEEQEEGEHDRHTIIRSEIHWETTHLLILPEILSVFESFFLNILEVMVGPAEIPQKSLTRLLSYSFFVSVFLTVWLPLCLSSAFGSSQTHSRSHTLTSAQWQPLPDRLTGVSPPRHPPKQGRTGPTCFLHSPSLPFLFIGALTHSQISPRVQGPFNH